MKKHLLALIVFIAACSSLFAADQNYFNYKDPAYATALASPFTKTSARVMAMGGAGLAVQNNADSLYINPASLGAKGLVFNIPDVAVTLYNIKSYNDEGILDSIIDDASNIGDNMGSIAGGLFSSSAFDFGRSKLATIDAGVGFKAGRFAMAVDTQVNLNVYNAKGGLTSIQIIPQVDIAFTTGLGLRFFRDNAINFDVGFSAGLNIRAFSEAVSYTRVKELLDSSGDLESLLNSQKTAMGWTIPLSFGVNVNFPFGFTIAAVASNINIINGGYNYKFSNFDLIKDDPMGEIFSAIGADEFTAKSDMNLALGVGWAPDLGGWKWLADPTVAIDFVDLIGLFDDFSLNSFLARLKMGAEIKLFKVLELRGGLNGGYVSLGLGVDLFKVIHLEASYYWNEFGENLGDKDVDAFTIRANIFWE